MTLRKSLLPLAIIAALMAGCNKSPKHQLTRSGLDPKNFVAEVNGKPTALYTLVNGNGMEVCITNYGGRIVSIMTPDHNGELRDVALGFDSVRAYFPENNLSDFGAAIGRYANRIDHGHLVIDGDSIQLPVNNFCHTLHGGPTGWQYQVYDVKQSTDSSLTLVMHSPDGDNNFPGNVTAEVTYTLTADNAIDITYSATTDAPTVINLTNHTYFNLEGDPTHDISDNVLYINASAYTPIDSTFMTSGEILPVADTPMDFSTALAVGARWDDFDFEQIKNANGYDHNYVLDTAGDISQVAASVKSPTSGIVLTVYTTEPGIQLYTGNFLDGTVTGKQGIAYPQRAALCLETQHYPDSPNKPHWPSVILRPGQTYTGRCIYKFTAE